MTNVFSWMDLIIAMVLLFMVRTASRHTVFEECFRLLSVLFAVFVSLHFYSKLGVFLQKISFFEDAMPNFLAFASLFLGIYFSLFLVRRSWAAIAKIDASQENTLNISVWISLLTAGVVSGQVLIACLLLNNSHIYGAFQQSLAGRFAAAVPLVFYENIHHALINTLYPDENMNESVALLLNKAGGKSSPETN